MIVRVLIQTLGTFFQKTLSTNAFQPSQPIVFVVCARFCTLPKKIFKKALDSPIIIWDAESWWAGLPAPP
jgi:hypothetical protein